MPRSSHHGHSCWLPLPHPIRRIILLVNECLPNGVDSSRNDYSPRSLLRTPRLAFFSYCCTRELLVVLCRCGSSLDVSGSSSTLRIWDTLEGVNYSSWVWRARRHLIAKQRGQGQHAQSANNSQKMLGNLAACEQNPKRRQRLLKS